MADDILSLKWNNHIKTFHEMLGSIRHKGFYSDATITCDGKFYPVHKLVLSSCSDYFGSIFDATQCKHPVIVIKDIKHEDMEALLNYMYLGEAKVARSLLPELFKAAECLKIKGLAIPDEALTHDETNITKPDIEGSPPRKRQKPDGPAPDTECMEISMRNQHDQEGHHQSEYVSQQESRAYDLKAHRDPFNVTKEEVDFESISESEVVEREKDIPELQEIMQPLMPTRQPHIAQDPYIQWKPETSGHHSNSGYPLCPTNSVMNMNMKEEPTIDPVNTLKCPYCPKTFLYPAKLQSHLRTHTGEKPFACPFCTYRATQQGNLNRHIKIKHHRENPENPEGN
ncbi:transcription factor GAGA-like [Penaeus chinensis]|uniref:transcription factor GAGA-like n=1 Tax=Penaeus chinensis TaxID=139456 RepID=UPI001FB7E723|nr:transcription factor GAGA-like [Penaeus chinensis]XP_047478645.1 transcription factor GAGA-like [Penaeus chinensis]